MSKIGEKILLTRVKSGDKDAFGKLYDLYVDKIYRFIYFKVSSTSDAEDLTSEVFLRVWQYIKDGVVVDNINAFLYRVSRNAVIDFYRKNRGKETVDIDDYNIVDNIKSDNLIDKIDVNFKIKDIIERLNSLKEEYKEVILLKYVEEYTTKEIAEIMGKSRGAVRVLLHRALDTLRSDLGKK